MVKVIPGRELSTVKVEDAPFTVRPEAEYVLPRQTEADTLPDMNDTYEGELSFRELALTLLNS